MQSLAFQRCFNHAAREAVARCPGCQGFFCRECITEHEERVLCTACLRKTLRVPLSQRRAFIGMTRASQVLLGVFVAWFFFFLIGQRLLRTPDAFHEQTLWQVPWLERE